MGLGELPLFADAPPAAIDTLLARLTPARLSSGEVLMAQGDESDFFAILLSGEVAVERRTLTGVQSFGALTRGDVIGELGLLRSRPRVASVTASTDLDVLVGDAEAFHTLLDVPGIHDRLQLIVSRRVAENVTPVVIAVRDGATVALRPLLSSDRETLFQGIREASAETLRRRFFSAGVPKAVLEYLINVDYIDHFAWACIDEHGKGVGVARFIRSDEHAEHAEFAFAVADAWQGHGVGTLLVGAVAVAASAAGVKMLTATFLRDNEPVRAVLRKAGASFGLVEPGVASAEMPTSAAEAVLSSRGAEALRAAVSDVVSAAGLAQA